MDQVQLDLCIIVRVEVQCFVIDEISVAVKALGKLSIDNPSEGVE